MHFDKKKSIKIIITEKSDKADWALKVEGKSCHFLKFRRTFAKGLYFCFYLIEVHSAHFALQACMLL